MKVTAGWLDAQEGESALRNLRTRPDETAIVGRAAVSPLENCASGYEINRVPASSARSTTDTSTGPRADTSLSPNCSCSAVKIDGLEVSVGFDAHARSMSKSPRRFVRLHDGPVNIPYNHGNQMGQRYCVSSDLRATHRDLRMWGDHHSDRAGGRRASFQQSCSRNQISLKPLPSAPSPRARCNS